MKIILNLQVKVSGVAYNQRLEAEPSLLKQKQEEKRLHKPVAFKLQVKSLKERACHKEPFQLKN